MTHGSDLPGVGPSLAWKTLHLGKPQILGKRGWLVTNSRLCFFVSLFICLFVSKARIIIPELWEKAPQFEGLQASLLNFAK